jgi:putative SOS response-associated peptidase YedK
MCGRYIFYDEKNAQLKEMIAQAKEKLPQKTFSEISLFEVFPRQKAFAAVFDKTKDQSVIKVMQWGFDHGGKIVINARSETCFTSSFFSDAVPCVLPASSYFEWTKKHQKYKFRTRHETIYLGGVAREEENGWHFVILTEEATGRQAEIHTRQPLVFNYEDAKKWCASKHPTSLFAYSIQERSCEKSE